MKVWLLYALALFSYLETAQCCSCVPGSFQRSRDVVIRDDFCFSRMVYTARVVGATCNCLSEPVANITNLRCVDYTQESTNVSAEVVALGECDGDVYGLGACANLTQVLSVAVDTNITQRMDLPTVNLTELAEFGRCPLVCPFNNRSSDIELSYPCQYTVEVLKVFKPQNYSVSGTIRVEGPDVLTTCSSDSSRRLHIGETYLVGVGGGCNPISGWSTLGSYSEAEIDLLEMLSTADRSLICGALGIVPSLVTLLLCTLLIVVMVV